jgi:hypothetical protein
MYSHHATSTTQEVLDALMIKYLLCQLAITPTSIEPTPSPAGPETQDIPLPDAPITAPQKANGWKTVEGKATQRRKQKVMVDKKRTEDGSDKPPMTRNGGQGKNSHQP